MLSLFSNDHTGAALPILTSRSDGNCWSRSVVLRFARPWASIELTNRALLGRLVVRGLLANDHTGAALPILTSRSDGNCWSRSVVLRFARPWASIELTNRALLGRLVVRGLLANDHTGAALPILTSRSDGNCWSRSVILRFARPWASIELTNCAFLLGMGSCHKQQSLPN